jgi:plasmid stabilization system protein ParE
MTSKRASRLPVVYASAARSELEEIWEWNDQSFGRQHAANYVDFLIKHIERLGRDHQTGRSISARPELRYLPIKFKSGGHYHVAVYSVGERAVNILHIFHTAQDWQAKLTAEKPVD